MTIVAAILASSRLAAAQSSQPGVATTAPASVPASAAATAPAALEAALAADPTNGALWLAYIDRALDAGQPAVAMQRFRKAATRIPPNGELHLRAAAALAAQGEFLGRVETRAIGEGRVGQFSGDWLIFDKADGVDQFQCVPTDSALYQIRQAMDAGVNRPEADLLLARIWAGAGRPAAAWQAIRANESRLLDWADASALARIAEIALSAGQTADALRLFQRQADRDPDHAEQIRFGGYVRTAEVCGQRGDGAMYLDLLGRAAVLRPKDAAVNLRLADAQYDAGRREEAARSYRRVIDADPNHPQRAKILRRIVE